MYVTYEQSDTLFRKSFVFVTLCYKAPFLILECTMKNATEKKHFPMAFFVAIFIAMKAYKR